MVGRLVEQQHVGLGHQHPGQHGKSLPAAAQMSQRLLPQGFGYLKGFQHHVDPPLFAAPLVGGERFQHGRVERPVHQNFRHMLLDIADRQAPGFRDFAFARLHGAGHATQQGGFAAAIGGDQPDPVAGIDYEVQPGKQRRAQRYAEISECDKRHDRSQVLPADRDIRGMQPSSDVGIEARRGKECRRER